MNALTTSLSPIAACAILGIRADTDIPKADILGAFRSLASTNHPDRGGDTSAMRELIEARDVLLDQRSRYREQPQRTRVETAEAQEMQAFSQRVKVDLADCYLALPRIWKWGLTLDHPRAAKLARAEANRSIRAEWAGAGVVMPPRDGHQASIDSDSDTDASIGGIWMNVAGDQIAKCFRDKPAADKKWAAVLIHPSTPATPVDKLVEKEEADERRANGLPADPQEAQDLEREAQKQQAMALRGALKPRDRQILDLYVGQGLSIKQVAEIVGKTPNGVYESVKRMGKPMRAEKVRREWVQEHCSVEKMASGIESAPIVLGKTGQLGWDLGGDA
ncbi:hypothetical protein [Acidithiobacillus ferriphilus]|uniref:hypothetical protein n=1 Tax=Acidithiobacillus ferriphilus TaxID=1689834 RepID=UPI002DBE3400|nr:hypothetical protein [Acidithiobacillus ferriphilus]MEB8535245.1 hypothetical protein [Acidithiobacillus ferriphilus]